MLGCPECLATQLEILCQRVPGIGPYVEEFMLLVGKDQFHLFLAKLGSCNQHRAGRSVERTPVS